MEKWLFLLVKAGSLSEIPGGLDDREPFKAFFEASETAAFTNEESIKYAEDMMTEWDINCAFEDHEAKGRAEGRAEGLAEGLAAGREALKETARKMLNQGIPVDVVINCTDLPEDVVASLQ